MDENEMGKYLQFLTENDELFRGKYLYQTARVEEYLNGVIAYSYFPNDIEKRKSLVGFIITKINFNSKIDIFIKILKKYHPEILEKFSELNADFKIVRELRNKLAHSQLDTSIEYLQTKPEKIQYEYYKDGEKKYLTLTISDMQDHIRDVFGLFTKLTKVMEAVSENSEWRLSEKSDLSNSK